MTIFAFGKAAAASAQEREAKWQAEIALQQRDNARAINDLFRNFLLKGHAKGPDARFMEVFDELRKQIGEDTKSSREFRNDVNFTLGQILMQRGDYNAAEPHVRAMRELSLELFDETHQRSINSIYHLGMIEGHKREREVAVKMIRQAIEMSRLHHLESGALPYMLLDLGARLGNRGNVKEAEKLILSPVRVRRNVFGQGGNAPAVGAPLRSLGQARTGGAFSLSRPQAKAH